LFVCFFLQHNLGRSSAEWLELVGDRASKKTLPTGPGYVYIISKEGAPPGENNVKIGRSVDPDARRTQLQVGNDRPLVVSARYWVNNMLAAEAAAHDAMDQYRVHGEWFSLPPGGIARVKQIVSAAIGQK